MKQSGFSKRRTLGFALGAIAFATCFSPTLLFAANATQYRSIIGSVSKLQGAANGVLDGATRSLSDGDRVHVTETLNTEPASRLKITLTDDSELTLGEGASLKLTEFVFDPLKPSVSRLQADMVTGSFLFVSGRTDARVGGTIALQTPFGPLAVQSATVWGGLIDGKYSVLVVEGEARLGASPNSVALTSGMASQAEANGTLSPPVKWQSEKVARAIATISFDPVKSPAFK